MTEEITEETIALVDAFYIVDREAAKLARASEIIDVQRANGRILAKDQTSLLNLPLFNKSAMDGYAVLNDKKPQYKLIEIVPAGSSPKKTLSAETTIKVMTGAPVPAGSKKVIPIENTKQCGDLIHILEPTKADNICSKGEDLRCGDLVLKSGVRLGALEIANLVSCGISRIHVYRKLRIAIISTGDELVEDFRKLTPGKIMNSNAPMLKSLCKEHALDVVADVVVGDALEETVEALRKAITKADFVLISGGVSVGDFDYAKAALAAVGCVTYFDKVAIKPGKPITFATVENTLIFGLPGNPVSVYLMFHLFVLRTCELICGIKKLRDYLLLPLDVGFKRRNTERLEYVPCRINRESKLVPVNYHGSAHLLALLKNDGFFIVPQGSKELLKGDKVKFISFKSKL